MPAALNGTVAMSMSKAIQDTRLVTRAMEERECTAGRLNLEKTEGEERF